MLADNVSAAADGVGQFRRRTRGLHFRTRESVKTISDFGIATEDSSPIHCRRSSCDCLFRGQLEHGVGHPALEAVVVHELFEELVVVLHHRGHHAQQRLVVFDAGVLAIRVLMGVPEGGVLRHPGGNGLGDELPHAVRVFPLDIAEEVIEGPDDVREPIELGIGVAATGAGRHRVDLGVLVGQHDSLHRSLLDPVAVHVDGIENAL